MSAGLFLAVAAGGLIGAPCRFLVDRAITSRTNSDLPWGTVVINVTGSLVLGFLTGLTLHHHLAAVLGALFATGFCGTYTTFSTFTFESLRLVEDGRLAEAMANIVGSVAIGLAAAAAGLAIGLAL